MVNENQLHIVAAVCFLHRDGKYLILKRSMKEIQQPGMWTIPGGKVERGDTIMETVIKEIKEETGLETKGSFEFLGDDEFTRVDGYHVVAPRFIAEAKEGEVKIDEDDFDDYAWVGSIEDLEKYEIITKIKEKLVELLKNE